MLLNILMYKAVHIVAAQQATLYGMSMRMCYVSVCAPVQARITRELHTRCTRKQLLVEANWPSA